MLVDVQDGRGGLQDRFANLVLVLAVRRVDVLPSEVSATLDAVHISNDVLSRQQHANFFWPSLKVHSVSEKVRLAKSALE